MRSAGLKRKPYTVYAVRGSKLRRAARVFFATLLSLVALILVAAGGFYLWLDMQVREANQAQRPGDSAAVSVLRETVDESVVDPVLEKPDAQDFVVLGSDFRASEGEEYGRSDTIMLVHIDPEQDFVSILSLPRDLRVAVPGHGKQKINGAFALGGAALAIETIQTLTRLDMDHYVNIDFAAFREITTALGGIYVDVDRRYYNAGDSYEKVDIEPGYQALAGEQALDYVRFRHDNAGDFGRIERQHRFLQAARDQISKWDAAFKIPELVQVIARNTTTDISTPQALKLALWALRLDGSRIKNVKLVADIAMIDGLSYVVASDQAIRDSVSDLVAPPTAPPAEPSGSTTATSGPGDSTGSSISVTIPVVVDLTGVTLSVFNGNGRQGEAGAARSWLESMGATVARIGDAPSRNNAQSLVVYPPAQAEAARLVAQGLGLTKLEEDASEAGMSVVLGADFVVPEEFRPRPAIDDAPDAAEWKSLAQEAPFPLMAPSSLPPYYKLKDSRLYEIETADGPQPALKVYYRYGREDQYLGVMETTFVDAPAAALGEEVIRDGAIFTVVGSDGKVDRVWWEKDGVLYWVSNTLFYQLGRDAMLDLASSMIPVP